MTATYSTIRQDLHNRYGHVVSEDAIDSLLNEAWVSHAATAVIQDFVPVLVEREVSETLEQEGAVRRARIAFVSRTNPALADVAVSITRYLNPTVAVWSDNYHPENLVSDSLAQALKEQNIAPTAGNLRQAEPRTLEAADYVVYLNDNEGNNVGGAVQENWNIEADTAAEFVAELRERIENRLASLTPSLVSAELAY